MTATERTTTTLSAAIADAVTRITWNDIPDDVRAVGKAHALDAIGIAIASTGMDYGHAVHTAGTRLATGGDSHVLGFGTPLPAADAALVDGTLMHGLDFDDTHVGAIYHASGPALAAALTVGETLHATGRDVLTAYILGMEVGCRLAAAGAGKFHLRGFHPTGIAGTFAAACVTAKLRKVSAETLTSALGLCGSQAAGILELHGSWLKRMHPGWAAHSGIIAATLAEAGFRGPARVLEGPAGLYKSHLGETVTADDLGIHDLGRRWMTADIALKPYPCCHFTHAFVDAAASVLAQLGRTSLRAGEIETIVCPTTPALQAMVTEPADVKQAPKTIYDALFSVQYVTAIALAGRPVDLAAFYDTPLDDPDILALAAKVACPADNEADFPTHFSGEVIVHLIDGTIAQRRVHDSHGTSQDPMTDPEVLAKFHATAGRRIDRAQRDRIALLVTDLDHVADASDLIDACTAAASASVQGSD